MRRRILNNEIVSARERRPDFAANIGEVCRGDRERRQVSRVIEAHKVAAIDPISFGVVLEDKRGTTVAGAVPAYARELVCLTLGDRTGASRNRRHNTNQSCDEGHAE